MPQRKQIDIPFENSYAFIIGIDKYKHVSELNSAVKDATDIANLLGEDKHGYQVHLITDASKRKLLGLFKKMKKLVKPNDRVIFYFAGHGIANDSEGDPKGFLVPADAKTENEQSLLPMNVLRETLTNLPCKHGLVILDCCFAGSFKWSTGFRGLGSRPKPTLYAERVLRFVEHPAWQVITSSAHDQKASDLLNKQALGLREIDFSSTDNNSPFAWALKQALNLHSKADTAGFNRSDGIITATELYAYVRDFVETATLSGGKRQSPAIFTLEKHDTKGEFIFFNPGHPLNLEISPDTNPYKGLKAYDYTEEDSLSFFGRKQAIKDMREKLAQSSILVVSAPSGQGKSSTVKAGLFPAINKKNANPIILRPGDRNLKEWRKLQTCDPASAQLILIDQYEEIFDLDKREQKKLETYLKKLWLKIKEHKSPKLKLIITIRSDFEWQLKSSLFGQTFWDQQNLLNFLYRLPPMTLEELREMIVNPAWTVAYEFESEDLVDQILDEINHAPGALPLLSFTLHQLFKKRNQSKRLLTRTVYKQQIGGVNGALSKHADEIYKELNAAQQDGMRKLLLRMVQLNDGNYSKRRVYLEVNSNKANNKTYVPKDSRYYKKTSRNTISELNYPAHIETTIDEVVELLSSPEHLLLIKGKDELGYYVEPMHDSLINFWPKCLQWIQDFGRENLVLQRQLWQAVVEHHQWRGSIYGTPDGKKATRPLWDNNPKLQQVQIAITDPRDEWLCKKGWADKSIASVAYLIWETNPSDKEMEEMMAWNWFFKAKDSKKLYPKIRSQMDHWLNEEELDFVKESFEKQRSELEQALAERNEAIKAKKKAEDQLEKTVLAIKSANNSGSILKRLILDGKLAATASDILGQLVLTSVILSNEEERLGSAKTHISRGYYDSDITDEAIQQYLGLSHHSFMIERTDKKRHLRMQMKWLPLKQFKSAANAISYLQFFLCNAGFLLQKNLPKEAWGIYGYETLAGIRFFQEHLRTNFQVTDILVPNGLVNSNTWTQIIDWASQNKKCTYDFEHGKTKSKEYNIWMRFLKKLHTRQKKSPSPTQQLIETFSKDSDTQKLKDWNLTSDVIHLIGIRRNEDESILDRKNDDLFILLINGIVFKFWGSTDPNAALSRRQEEAFLAEGQHVYRMGWYRMHDPKKVYKALRPVNKGVLVFRDRDRNDALSLNDLKKGLDSKANPSITFNWSGSGKKNWSAGNNVLAGASYINPKNQVIDCRAFASTSYKGLALGKTQGAFNVFMDLLTINSKPTDTIYYNLINEEDLKIDSKNFPADYAANILERLNPK